jgi:probable HAF family extracellular repeat protein
MVGLGDLPGGRFVSSAFGVSGDGKVIVGYGSSSRSTGGSEAFRWTAAGGMVGLGDLAGGIYNSAAFAASFDGSVIVGISSGQSPGTEAFIWTARTGMVSLRELLMNHEVDDLAGWSLTEVRGISADGRTIAGSGYNPAGRSEAWLATIAIPEPSVRFLLTCGLGVAAASRRVRQMKKGGPRNQET